MQILVLGGTRVVGRHLVQAALARGHAVTLFNRGRTDDALFPEAEHLHGDRDGHLEALDGRHWDAVVDTCGYVPRVVRQSVDRLRGSVGRYLFVSTISVYEDLPDPGADEDAPLRTLDDPTVQTVTGENATVVRPGMVVGPHDHTDRYTYWLVRVRQGGAVLVPGVPERPVQRIDARDLGAFMVHLLERDTPGVFQAVGPDHRWTSRDVMDVCEFALDVGRAVAGGLTFRPALDTARDTLRWRGDVALEDLAVGLAPAREAALLAEAGV